MLADVVRFFAGVRFHSMTPSSARPDRRPQPAELAMLSDVLRSVARSRRLRPEDADDYIQSAHCRLIERNYDVFERFAGRSSLKTYLTVVAVRLLLDWRNSRFGKWRPSREAQRLGQQATALERLMSRDHLSPSEAVTCLSLQTGASPDELDALRHRLPVRVRRRQEPETIIDRETWREFEDPIEVAERRDWDERVRRALRDAVERLSKEDQILLQHRFAANTTVRAAGTVLRTEPRLLYRRLQQVIGKLRAELENQGVDVSARAS